MVFLICHSRYTFLSILIIIGFGSLIEFYALVKKGAQIEANRVLGLSIGFVLNLLPFLIIEDFLSTKWLFLLMPFVAVVFISELFRHRFKPFLNIAITLAGWLYISLPLGMFYYVGVRNGDYQWPIILGCFLFLWGSDTGAYTAGKTLGKTKLFERISPNKTWEGSIGGWLLALVQAYIMSLIFTDVATWKWLTIATIIVVAGGLGDLAESQLKRSLNQKDSGTILPGHGGLLDRFDGLYISIPFVVAFLAFFG